MHPVPTDVLIGAIETRISHLINQKVNKTKNLSKKKKNYKKHPVKIKRLSQGNVTIGGNSSKS